MFAVALDTCVLWPSRQRDFFLSLAVEGLYRPVWSPVVLGELRYEEEAKLLARGEAPTIAAARADRLIDAMAGQFSDALAHGWERLDGTFGLPDPHDEHVLAAAVVAGASAVVTHNHRDFPATSMPWGIEVMTPARFATTTVELDPGRAAQAARSMASRTGRSGPALTPHEVLDVLDQRYAMRDAARLIRPHL